MKSNVVFRFVVKTLAAGLIVIVCGCSHNSPAPPPAAVKLQTDQNIQRVQNDSRIPDDQKARIVDGFKNPGGPPNMQPPAR